MGAVMVNSENFKSEVLESENAVLVDFYADWCGPCKAIVPVLEELATEYEGKAKICKVNVDNAQDIAGQFGVMSIPTLILFNKGQKVDQVVGAVPKAQLQALIDGLL